ncbi:MAG: SRPBCC domain-containing protein, partial [Acidimicrobiia bacterium]
MSQTPIDPERGYTITRNFDAPRPVVWQAITRADLFAQWFGAGTDRVEVQQWDLKPGGQWRATMHFEGNELPWT